MQQRPLSPWREALADLGGITGPMIAQMQAHWRLVTAWNRHSNLTAIAQEEDAAWLHYRDSLAALPLLVGRRLLDIGSGAGFPGLVLAVADPTLEVTLMEPRRRRASFLHTAVARLALSNVAVVGASVGEPASAAFDHAVTRATFSRDEFFAQALAWLRPAGTLLCYRAADTAPWGVRHPYRLAGPGGRPRTRCIDQICRAEASQSPPQ